MENEKLVKAYAVEIIKQFGVDQSHAEKLAEKLFIQIEALSESSIEGNVPKTVSVVIKSWMEH